MVEVRGVFKFEDEIDFMSVSNFFYLFVCLDEVFRMYFFVLIGLFRVVFLVGVSIVGYYVLGGVSYFFLSFDMLVVDDFE